MVTYILESETPEGMIYLDTRCNNSIHLKFNEEGGDYLYPPQFTARHLLNLLFGDQLTDCDLTWEVSK